MRIACQTEAHKIRFTLRDELYDKQGTPTYIVFFASAERVH